MEHHSPAEVEVPFQLFNDNLVIVKVTVGTVERCKHDTRHRDEPQCHQPETGRPTETAGQNGSSADAERDNSDPEPYLALYPDWPIGGSPYQSPRAGP